MDNDSQEGSLEIGNTSCWVARYLCCSSIICYLLPLYGLRIKVLQLKRVLGFWTTFLLIKADWGSKAATHLCTMEQPRWNSDVQAYDPLQGHSCIWKWTSRALLCPPPALFFYLALCSIKTCMPSVTLQTHRSMVHQGEQSSKAF